MDVEDYIRGLADEDLKKEIRRRNEEATRQAQERMERQAEQRWAARQAAMSEFCAALGITEAQFEAVAEYLEYESERMANTW